MNEREKIQRQLQAAQANNDARAVAYFQSRLNSLQEPSQTQPSPSSTAQQLSQAQQAGDSRAVEYFTQKLQAEQNAQTAQGIEQRAAGYSNREMNLGTADAMASFASDMVSGFAENLLNASQANPVGRATVKWLSGRDGDITEEERAELPKELASVISWQPVTPQGKDMKALIAKDIGTAMESVGLDKVGEFIGNRVNDFEDFASEYVGRSRAQALTAFPAVVLEILPFAKTQRMGSAGQLARDEVTDAVKISNYVETPDMLAQAKAARNEIYSGLKDDGAFLKTEAITKAIDAVADDLMRQGVDLTGTGMLAKLEGAKVRFSGAKTVSENVDRGRFRGTYTPEGLRIQRFSRQNVTRAYDPPQVANFQDFENLKNYLMSGGDRTNGDHVFARSRAGRVLDQFLDRQLQDYVVPNGNNVRDVKKQIRAARDIAGRVRRAEDLGELWYSASLRDGAGAQMKQLRDGARAILTNKQTRKFYNKDEIILMEQIARNAVPDDTSIMRLLGATGATILPPAARFLRSYYGGKFREMPTVSRAKYFAESMLKNTERTGDAFTALQRRVLASKDANEAFTRYLKAVPKNRRDPAELGLILGGSQLDLDRIAAEGSKLKKEAVQIAKGYRYMQGIVINAAIDNEDEQEDEQIY